MKTNSKRKKNAQGPNSIINGVTINGPMFDIHDNANVIVMGKTSSLKHHLFENEVLNQLFCRTEEDTRTFCRESVSTFRELFGEDAMVGEEYRVICYQAAMMETAFEMGWREALRREAIPRIKQVRNTLLAHCDILVAQRDGKEPTRVRLDKSAKGGAA